MRLAHRVNNINPSFTLEMVTKAADMISRGIDVINFSVGEPDFNTPNHIRDAAKNAIDQGYTKCQDNNFHEGKGEGIKHNIKIARLAAPIHFSRVVIGASIC